MNLGAQECARSNDRGDVHAIGDEQLAAGLVVAARADDEGNVGHVDPVHPTPARRGADKPEVRAFKVTSGKR
jgi:hypothetical protein